MHFENKTIYEIYIKSFQDSNGDGIGDIPGITSRLDYLRDLGVDYIWITPFFMSPLKDNGYDISDYYTVNPMFGTLSDLDRLIAEADRRGIGIILDMVFNHTSTQHPWFQKALQGDPEYMEYYYFRDTPTNWHSKFGNSAWEYVPQRNKYYLHLFDKTQADLNWSNKKVRDELKKVLLYWKNRGVKGFRFDVVNLISKPTSFRDDEQGDGRHFYTDGENVHAYLRELVTDTGIEEYLTIGEMSSSDLTNCIGYSRKQNRELSMVFHFHHLKVDYKDMNKWELMKPDMERLKQLLIQWQTGMQEGGGWDALFWCNHDQPRAVSRFGNDRQYWKESAKMLATALYLMRGTPCIYQGEELGQPNAGFTDIRQYRDVESVNYYDILQKEGKSRDEVLTILSERSRDNGRTPLCWDASQYNGFSTVKPWIMSNSHIPKATVTAEESDPDSILNYYKRLLKLRKESSALSKGSITFPYPRCRDVLAYERTWGPEKKQILCNMTENTVTFRLPKPMGTILLHNRPDIHIRDEILTLGPFEAIVYEEET